MSGQIIITFNSFDQFQTVGNFDEFFGSLMIP